MKVLIEAAVAEFNKAFEKSCEIPIELEWHAGAEELREFTAECEAPKD